MVRGDLFAMLNVSMSNEFVNKQKDTDVIQKGIIELCRDLS